MKSWIACALALVSGSLVSGSFVVSAPAALADDIDLDKYRMTFDEPFDKLDVSAWGTNTRWIAHTPWNGDFGDAAFIDPRPDAPFSVKDGILSIEMKKNVNGKWQSGLLSSLNKQGGGFSQAMGYFEVRAKMPVGKGVWPAFWLIGTDRSQPIPEVDIVEYYGQAPGQYVTTLHIWKKKPDVSVENLHFAKVKTSLTDDFHTYGVAIDDTDVRFFFDRREVWRAPALPEYRKPLAILVNLAAGAGWPIAEMPDPSVMQVDYIRAYLPK